MDRRTSFNSFLNVQKYGEQLWVSLFEGMAEPIKLPGIRRLRRILIICSGILISCKKSVRRLCLQSIKATRKAGLASLKVTLIAIFRKLFQYHQGIQAHF